MSQLKVNTVRHTAGSADNITLDNSQNVTVEGNLTVDGTTTLTGTVTGDNHRTQPFRNLIINGAMVVAQRGTSSTATAYGCVDRVKHDHGGADEAPTKEQVSLTSSDTGPWEKGFRKAFKVTNGNQTSGAGAGDYMQIDVSIVESIDVATSGWNYTSSSSYLTLSFWVKASVAQNYPITFRTHDGTAKVYNMTTGSLTANTWTKVTKTIPGHADLQFDLNYDKGIRLMFGPHWGTTYTTTGLAENTWSDWANEKHAPDVTTTWWTTNDATFELTGVQLEVGSTATDFEHRSYGDELAKCQRYYEQSDSTANATTGNWWFYPFGAYELWGPNSFRVEKRDTPTIVTHNNAGGTGGAHRLGSPDVASITAQKISRYGVQKLGKSDGGLTAGNPYICGWSASSEL